MAWTMRLSDEEEALLAARAEAEGRSKQEIARDALRLYLSDRTTRFDGARARVLRDHAETFSYLADK